MANLFDYLDWRGDISFAEVGIGEVDNAVFSQLSFADFGGIVTEQLDNRISLIAAAKQYLRAHRGKTYIGAMVPAATISLLAKCAKSTRFSRVNLTGYINNVNAEKQIQFCAVTYIIGNGDIFVAFRGTDDSIVGWRENFNMSYMHPVPAQIEAVAYLESVAAAHGGKIYVGGHSKGGNLAVYAAVNCKNTIKDRIVLAYNNDGPGFDRAFLESLNYINMREKIRTLVPQSSVIGMLLEHEETYEVIKSNKTGLLQHDIFSWELLGGKFIHLSTVTDESKFIDATLKKWINDMTIEEREEFVESLFNALESTNAKTLTELNSDKIKLLRAWGSLNDEGKSVVLKSLKLFLKESTNIFKKNMKPAKKEIKEMLPHTEPVKRAKYRFKLKPGNS